MSEHFFEHPILNSPYDYPSSHSELDDMGQPTQTVKQTRRRRDFRTPIPKAKKQTGGKQAELAIDEASYVGDDRYANASIINALRDEVDRWRQIPSPSNWRVTPERQRLLQHWRHHAFSGIRPFFCQVEAAGDATRLNEVTPSRENRWDRFKGRLGKPGQGGNLEAIRLAMKKPCAIRSSALMPISIA